MGSDIAVKGEHPTYYQVYDKKPRLSQTERVAEVLRMLRLPEADRPQLVMLYFEDSDTCGHTYSPFSQETRKCIARLDALMRFLWEGFRPQLVMLYFEDSDTCGHTYSPFSQETRKCIARLDALMRFLWEGLQSLPVAKDVNLIVTSDHGMATVSADRFIPIKHLLKEEWYTLIDGNLPAQIYETRKCIARLDALMRFLWEGLQSLPFAKDVNLIVTSDHGMATVSADRFVPIKHLLKEEWYTLIDGNLPAQIYTQPQFRDSVYHALKDLNHVRVWKKEDIPAYLNYGSNPRVGDIIVLPDLGWLVEEGNKTLPGAHGFDPTYDDMQVMFRACGPDFKKGYEAPKFRNVSIYSLLARKTLPGAHGFDPTYDDMQVMFRACGPDFKKGYEAPKFRNVSIYSLLARLLQITPEKTDGCLEEVENMLIQ